MQPNSTTRWRKDLGEHPLEIVVVFDGSSDCTVEEVRKFTEAGLRLIEITEYNGKNFAMNIALKSIDCDVVVFSDANSELQSKALCYLMRQQTGETGRARVLDEFDSCKNVTELYRLLCQAGGPDKPVGISEMIPAPHHRDLGLAMRVHDLACNRPLVPSRCGR